MLGQVIEKEYAPRWEDLHFRYYPTGAPLREDEVVGIAVERDKGGYASCVYQSDNVKWTIESKSDAWAFLSSPDSRIFFVDGVNRELEPILKWLGAEVCEQLLDGFEVNGLRYHGSGLSVRRAKKIWSLKPFFTSDLLPPDDDCYGVQARGERLVRCIKDARLPLLLSSCGAILGGMTKLPYMSAPSEVEHLAYNSYHGGWIEAMKIGFFDHAYDYDLSSAYPTEAGKLLSCSHTCGSWRYSGERDNSSLACADYGFYRCRVRLDLSLPFSPLMVRVRSGMSKSSRWPLRVVRNPVGLWEGWLTLDELRFIESNWLGDVEILEGWWFEASRHYYPFRELVRQLREVRRRGERKGDVLLKNLGKLTAAAVQGKMMQSFLANGKRMVGNAMNPVYAATLTARVRLSVAEIAMENWDDVAMIMVDGIIATKPLAVPKEWKLAHSGECVIANHGDYSIPDRRSAGKLVRALEDNPLLTSYRIYAPRFTSLGEAFDGGKFEFACMRRPEVWSKVSRVGKRYWPNLPKTCEDLLTNQYDSYPLVASERTKMEI